MSRPSAPRWDKHNRRFRCRYQGKSINLGRNKAKAYAKFARLVPQEDAGDPRTVAELIAEWLNQKPSDWAERWLSAWNRWAGLLPLADVGKDHIEQYADRLEREEYGQTTRRSYIKIAYRVCAWAADKGWLAAVPRRPRLPRPRTQPRDISPSTLPDLIASLPKRAAAILLFCLESGCRPSEACRMQWADIDLGLRVATCRRHKTERSGSGRVIQLTNDAIAVLRGVEQSGSFVFTSRTGRPYKASGLRSILRRRGATPYQLRHTFAQAALDAGTPMEVVAKLLGHRGLSQVQIYAQVRDRMASQAARSLPSPLRPRLALPSPAASDGPLQTSPANPDTPDTAAPEYSI